MTDPYPDVVSPKQLVRAVDECGKYVFLIGAGTSKPEPAAIPTGSQLIDRWQKQYYDIEDPNENKKQWVARKEESLDDGQSRYGFWFEQCYPTRGQRREFIQDLVRDAEPTAAHVLLASMMNRGVVPHVLTPNFDDLLEDAFHKYLEDKPKTVNHRAIAPEFNLTGEHPAIVKLHGDYLYDNLQNTDVETANLKPAMEKVLKKTVSEYGLVVVGYSGTDDSIMDPLLEADISEYGVFWCTPDKNEELPAKVQTLLGNRNTRFVEIDGFVNLMTKFGREIDVVEFPKSDDIVSRAKEWASKLEDALEKSRDAAEDDEEEEFITSEQKFMKAHEARDSGDYETAIDLLDDVAEVRSDKPRVFTCRGLAKAGLEDWESAIEDFEKAIDKGSDSGEPWIHLARAKVITEDYEDAHQDMKEALRKSDSREEYAAAKLFENIILISLDRTTQTEKGTFERVCANDFVTNWRFEELDSWLEDQEFDDDAEKIEELIATFREHYQ